jgi:hypothetical protein
MRANTDWFRDAKWGRVHRWGQRRRLAVRWSPWFGIRCRPGCSCRPATLGGSLHLRQSLSGIVELERYPQCLVKLL